MAWAKLDDRYDDHGKTKRAWRTSGYAVGLHSQAITASARHESDGLLDAEWLADKLAVIPTAAARKAIDVLVQLGLFVPLAAGETVEVTDEKGNAITLGPVDEDTYVVHDYLDYNPSSVMLTERRARDRVRKESRRTAARSPRGVRKDSTRTGVGIQAASEHPVPSRPVPSPEDGADAPSVEPERLDADRSSSSPTAVHNRTARELFAVWQDRCGHPQAKATRDRIAKIVARLREGYTPGEIRTAIDGAARAAYVDDAGKRHDDIELICRNATKLDLFISRATSTAAKSTAGGVYDRAAGIA